jgi:ornithine cyclodeaminase
MTDPNKPKPTQLLKSRRLGSSIMGWGPIGQNHYKMVTDILKNTIGKIYLYDLREITPETIT